MAQASYRCVECSQPMMQAGMLCPACQKRTGKLETSKQPATAPDAGPLYATALATPPLYGAPPPQPINLAGDPVAGGPVPLPQSPAGSPGLPPVYTPPTPSVPPTASTYSSPPVYAPPTGAGTAPRPGAMGEDAMQRANIELATMKMKETETTRPRTRGERFLVRLGTRLALRLAIGIIAAIIAATSGLHHRQARMAETEEADVTDTRPDTARSFNGTTAPASGAFRAQPVRPGAMMLGQSNGTAMAGNAIAEQQQMERLNAAFDDAKRSLDVAERDDVVQGDLNRLLAQVDSDVQIMRAGLTRVSPQAVPSINQAIGQLTARAQALENRTRMPQMPQSAGPAMPENGGVGTPPPADNTGMAGPGGGQQGAPMATGDIPAANGAGQPAGDTSGQNPPPNGNGNQ